MTILRTVKLKGRHRPTGFTRHHRDGQLLPPPTELRVLQYDGSSGFHLVYCNRTGGEQNDTFHESLERALGQAELEFGVQPGEWEKTDVRIPTPEPDAISRKTANRIQRALRRKSEGSPP